VPLRQTVAIAVRMGWILISGTGWGGFGRGSAAVPS
jgi:hypothetical protein